MGLLRNPTSVLRALAFTAGLAVGPVSAQYNTGDSFSAEDSFDTQCTAFAETLRATYDNATIWFTEPVAAGTNLSLPDYDPSCGVQYQAVGVDMCRVAMFLPTSDRSNISGMSFALKPTWNVKY